MLIGIILLLLYCWRIGEQGVTSDAARFYENRKNLYFFGSRIIWFFNESFFESFHQNIKQGESILIRT